jgi:hypothetical protein
MITNFMCCHQPIINLQVRVHTKYMEDSKHCCFWNTVGYSFFETETFQDFRHTLRHSGVADSNSCTVVTCHCIAVVYFPSFNETILGYNDAYCFNILNSHY